MTKNAKRILSTTAALGAIAVSAIALTGCSDQSFDNAYDLWQEVDNHVVECSSMDGVKSGENEESSFSPAHSFANCRTTDIGSGVKIMVDTYVVDDEDSKDAFLEDSEKTYLVGPNWVIRLSNLRDNEMAAQSWLDDLQEDIGGEIQ